MWFNPHAKLAEIVRDNPATSATFATQTPDPPPESQKSRVSQGPEVKKPVFHVSNVATFATPQASAVLDGLETGAYGQTDGGRVKTWTGKVVNLAEWRDLSEWEKHGPKGKHFNGKTQQWEMPS